MALIRETAQTFSRYVLAMAATALTAAVAGDKAPVRTYQLELMAPVDIRLPIEGDIREVRYRNADGKWRLLPTKVEGAVLHVHVDLPDVRDGRTTLLLGAPEGVDLDDCEPPGVVRFEVDGVAYGSVDTVALGGVEATPATMSVEVRDALNPLRRESLSVVVNGRQLAADATSEVSFDSRSERHAVITVDLKALLKAPRRDNSVTLTIDDCAVDDRRLTCSLSFDYVEPRTLDDGRMVSVDSVDPNPGWRAWWVMFDGSKMDSGGSTTAGHTWLSEGNAMPHWVRVQLPEPRPVTGVAVWWAYWQGFRSSATYLVQTWDGSRWLTQVTVEGQGTTGVSRHTFAPVKTNAVRLWQPSMGGHPEEPQYMWISELGVLTE